MSMFHLGEFGPLARIVLFLLPLTCAGCERKAKEATPPAPGPVAVEPPSSIHAMTAVPGGPTTGLNEGNGAEPFQGLTNAVWKLAYTPDGRTLALTAYGRSEDRARALSAGFEMHVGKPVEPHELVTLVARLTERGDAPSGPA